MLSKGNWSFAVRYTKLVMKCKIYVGYAWKMMMTFLFFFSKFKYDCLEELLSICLCSESQSHEDRLHTLRSRQNGHQFPNDNFKCIFLNENIQIAFKISLKFVPRVQLTIFQHWFRLWLRAGQATGHDLNQWWLIYRRIYMSLSLNELTSKKALWQQHS